MDFFFNLHHLNKCNKQVSEVGDIAYILPGYQIETRHKIKEPTI